MWQIPGSFRNSNTLGLLEDPFDWNPNIRFFYPSPSRASILNEVIRTTRSFSERLLINGERGIGKTILARKLYSLFGKGHFVIPIYITKTKRLDDFVQSTLVALTRRQASTDNRESISVVEARIKNLYENDYRVAMIIDITGDVAEEVDNLICKLAKIRYSSIPILHMYFITSSDADNHNWYFRKEVRREILVPRLAYDEAVGMINFRCLVAGRLTPLFSDDGYKAIFEITGGNPGKMIRLCYPVMNIIASSGKQFGNAEEVYIGVKLAEKPSIIDNWLPSL